MSNPTPRVSRRSAVSTLLSLPLLGLPTSRVFAFAAGQGAAGAAAAPAPPDLSKVSVPTPKAEFRGVWVATVENIDWPSRPGLTVDAQKAELTLLLDRAQQLNLNAIVLQVRPATDALYKSDLEPWSEYLTGEMGKAPDPFYDPLEFAVAETHKRGMELHAWVNPFRARQKGAAEKRPASPDHISKRHPEWVRQYGKLQWLDPGVPAARDWTLAVILDIVRRYDIDGVHMDDYFYPYKEADAHGNEIPFPDEESYAAYKKSGGTLGVSDWRRYNIDDLISRMYRGIKDLKPWVKVGISPFGIWRPNNPYQIKGFDSYEQLACDSRKWLHEGWLDYITPQLYWKIEQTAQSFPVLLHWWIGENVKGRHVWPGLYTSLASGRSPRWPQSEVEYQIKTTRGSAGSTGEVHFSAEFLRAETVTTPGSLSQHLFQTVYGDPALVPATPWLGAPNDSLPAAPASVTATPATVNGQYGWNVTWTVGVLGGGITPPLTNWVVQWRAGGDTWHQATVSGTSPGGMTLFVAADLPPAEAGNGRRGGGARRAAAKPPLAVVAVSAVDRLGRVGAAGMAALG